MHKFKFMRQLEMVSFATSDKIWFIIILVPFFGLFNKSKNCAGFLLCCAVRVRKNTQKFASLLVGEGALCNI